jgi:hypothetical protein
LKPKVYLETTVISYLTAVPGRDIVQAAHQQITREWWERRKDFDLFVSQAVITEIGRGDSDAAGRRLAALENIAVLKDDARSWTSKRTRQPCRSASVG